MVAEVEVAEVVMVAAAAVRMVGTFHNMKIQAPALDMMSKAQAP